LLFGIHALAQTDEEAYYVLGLQGKWIFNSKVQLKCGSPLSAPGTIKLQDRQPGDFIEIADRGGRPQPQYSRRCDTEDCSQPILIRAEQNGVFSRLFSGIMRMLWKNDDGECEVVISRGGELREAVVPITGEQVDLTAIFAGKGRGPYLLRFIPKGSNAKRNASMLDRVRIEWNPGRSCIVTVKGLNTGLYEVQLLGNDGEPLEPGTEAWALIVKPENFGSKSREFREAQSLTKTWPKSIRHSTKRQFLRAALAKLEIE